MYIFPEFEPPTFRLHGRWCHLFNHWGAVAAWQRCESCKATQLHGLLVAPLFSCLFVFQSDRDTASQTLVVASLNEPIIRAHSSYVRSHIGLNLPVSFFVFSVLLDVSDHVVGLGKEDAVSIATAAHGGQSTHTPKQGRTPPPLTNHDNKVLVLVQKAEKSPAVNRCPTFATTVVRPSRGTSGAQTVTVVCKQPDVDK